MTTASYSIEISRRAMIVGAFCGLLVTIAVAILIGFTLEQNQPSETDLLVRAMAGDEGAAKTLEERYFEPSPVPISPKEANFTPGIYTEANVNATDGAEVAASFVLFLLRGKIEALNLLENPYLPGRLQQASSVIGEEFIEEDGELTGLGFITYSNGGGVLVSDLVKWGVGPVLSGEKIETGEAYFTVVTTPSGNTSIAVISMRMNDDGEWKIFDIP